MQLTQLIKDLTRVLLEHGDIPVVTPGFDESNFEDVATVEVVRVVFNYTREPNHSGRHIAADDIEYYPHVSGEPEKALLINW